MSASTTSVRRRQIVESLQDKEYRDLFVQANIRNGIAFQIRAMREDRGWTQGELGRRAGKVQEVISKLEDPDYGRFTLITLCRLASAFDVALTLKFLPFSVLADELAGLSPSDLSVPGFADDEGLAAEAPLEVLPPTSTDAQLIVDTSQVVPEFVVASNITYTYMERWRQQGITDPLSYEHVGPVQEQ